MAQDAGVPQAGCRCARCRRAWTSPDSVRLAACLGIIDHPAQRFWLVDATPDIRSQLATLHHNFTGYELAGVALTHAHAGHYTGLVHFGKEGWNTAGLPLYASSRMLQFLLENQPWASLLAANLKPVVLEAGVDMALSDLVGLLPVAVPHRGEFSDTLAFTIVTEERKLFYCPDIDGWQGFDLEGALAGVEYALLDGSFYSADELPGRDLADIPHPLAADTAARVADLPVWTWLVHLNHSNPLHDQGPERGALESRGIGIGWQSQRWSLE